MHLASKQIGLRSVRIDFAPRRNRGASNLQSWPYHWSLPKNVSTISSAKPDVANMHLTIKVRSRSAGPSRPEEKRGFQSWIRIFQLQLSPMADCNGFHMPQSKSIASSPPGAPQSCQRVQFRAFGSSPTISNNESHPLAISNQRNGDLRLTRRMLERIRKQIDKCTFDQGF